MARKTYAPAPRDRHVYIGRFEGYRMLAFGRVQILDYAAEIQVYQAQHYPPVWCAMDQHGKVNPAFNSHRAEDTMRLVEESFTTCLARWETFEYSGLEGLKKLGPQLVDRRDRKTG
jgi:hypothetical protein